jgi:UDP-N-acetylglucosamine acyltransferase
VSAGVHPAALIDPTAELGAGVQVGPFAVVGAGVRLGDGVTVGHHASVLGPSAIGAGTHIFPFA